MSTIKDICCNLRLQDLVLAGWPPCCATSSLGHVPVIHAASHFYHQKRVAWVSISIHACDSAPIVMVYLPTRTSLGVFGNDRVVFKIPSTASIKISRLHLRKSWQVYYGAPLGGPLGRQRELDCLAQRFTQFEGAHTH